jgi:hypothetical protein
MKKNYKKAFDVLLRNHYLWKDRTDEEKAEIFKTLNEVAGFSYDLKDYQTNQSLRNQIIDLIKEKDIISIEDLKIKLREKDPYLSEDIFLIEVKRLLEDGYIFEPKVNFLRWLGI